MKIPREVPVRIKRGSRLFLLLLSESSFLIGVYFYTYPTSAKIYWAWTVAPLAVRFLGAIFLAITFGCWSVLREDLWQRSKILVLVGATFYLLSGVVTFYQAILLNNLGAWLWTLYFLTGSLGLFLVIRRYGWYMTIGDFLDQPEANTTARLFFRIQTIIVGIFGSILVLLPDLGQAQFWPWKVSVLATLQIFGALFIATCLATGWASIQKDLGRMRILLPLDASFPALALLAVFWDWNIIVQQSPNWPATPAVWVGLYFFVAVGSTILYWKIRVRRR